MVENRLRRRTGPPDPGPAIKAGRGAGIAPEDGAEAGGGGSGATLEFAAQRAVFRFEPGLVAARQIARLIDQIVARDAALKGAELRVDRRDVGVGPVGDLLEAGDPEAAEQRDQLGPDALEQLEIVGLGGGRVLGVTATGKSVTEAQARAYAAVDRLDFASGFCRRDIGWREVAREAE